MITVLFFCQAPAVVLILFNFRVCTHLLAILIQKKCYDVSINFKKAKKRSRKPKVKNPLERDENSG